MILHTFNLIKDVVVVGGVVQETRERLRRRSQAAS